MNLMKLFNIKYLKQNFKKSSSVLLIFTMLIPILNTLILIMQSTKKDIIPSFLEISLLHIIGIYILPIIISICLFSYLFKKQSVDFIGSMPIKRKTIYLSNILGGLFLIISMLIVNVILILLVSLVFKVHIPLIMLLEYIGIWFITYSFSLASSFLAVSISGNAITSIVVSILLIFFIPFTSSFVNLLHEEGKNVDYLLEMKDEKIVKDNYICTNKDCETNKSQNLYDINLTEKNNSNTARLFNFLFGYQEEEPDFKLYSNTTMIILSIIYFIIGYFAFTKRKMENCETSFKNIHAHNIIKGLTLAPFMAVSYAILRESPSIISFIFVFVLLVVYALIYDLITKKNISNLKISSFYFALFVALYIGVFSISDINSNDTKIIEYGNIKKVSIDLNSINDSRVSNKILDTKNIFIDNARLKELVIKNSLTNNRTEYKNSITAYIKLENNKVYKLNLYTNDDYEEILSTLYSNDLYKDIHKNIDYNKIYAVKVGNQVYNKKEQKELLSLLEKTLNNLTLKEYIFLVDKYRYTNDNNYQIKLYTYKNHDKYEYTINSYISYDLLNFVVNKNNSYLKENLDKIHKSSYEIFYQNKYFNDNYVIDYTCMVETKDELYDYVKEEIKNQVDMKKEYITLELCEEGRCYIFTSNNISKFKKILDTKYEELVRNGFYIDITSDAENSKDLAENQEEKENYEY